MLIIASCQKYLMVSNLDQAFLGAFAIYPDDAFGQIYIVIM